MLWVLKRLQVGGWAMSKKISKRILGSLSWLLHICIINNLVGGWVSTHLKNMRKSKWDHFPKVRGEHKNIFETTTFFSAWKNVGNVFECFTLYTCLQSFFTNCQKVANWLCVICFHNVEIHRINMFTEFHWCGLTKMKPNRKSNTQTTCLFFFVPVFLHMNSSPNEATSSKGKDRLPTRIVLGASC